MWLACWQQSVNVYEAVAFGKRQWRDYEKGRLPDGLHNVIKKVARMTIGKKSVKLGSDFIFDAELINARRIGLIHSRKCDQKIYSGMTYLQYRHPCLTTMVTGNMRITKSKSVLKQKLQVSNSTRTSQPQVVIIDESAMLWVIYCQCARFCEWVHQLYHEIVK